jgi:ferrous iron transport protein A
MRCGRFMGKPNQTAKAAEPLALDRLEKGNAAIIMGFHAPADDARQSDTQALIRRLRELGFVVGERVRVLQQGIPGGEPIAVRIGNSTFALRRFEAALISVVPEVDHAC